MIAVELDFERIAEFCRRHPIEQIALFGSVLRDDFGPESDVDFLVKFKPGANVGLFDVVGMEMELSKIIGRKADMRTVEELSQYFRNEVVQAAQVIYERP